MTSPGRSGTEERLTTRAQSGDAAAFRELTRGALPLALRAAKNVLLSDTDAEDVVQEAFIRAWRSIARYDPKRSKFSTWLFRIVVNIAIDRRRTWRHRPETGVVIEVADERPNGESLLLDQEREKQVRSAIADLPERQRTAISLFYLQGCSIHEAAGIMETNDVAFQGLLARARNSLKTRLAGA
jgi:RNA polymerase sigma-70 factor (ECF subfamily)